MTRRRLLLALLALAAPAHAKRASPRFRIVALSVQGDATIVTVAGGTEDGITTHWHARFVTPAGKLGDGELVIIRVDKRRVVLRTKLDPDRVRQYDRVQFDPP